jgi:glycosyltransferase involved in cell wall biosynthesis
MEKRRIICFLVPFKFNESPSQRFRYEQYIPLLESRGFKITLLPFSLQSSSKLRASKRLFTKLFVFARLILLRPFHLRHVIFSDFVFIHREVAPVGPPLLEWLIAKILRKKIIYDFDDAIWLTDNTDESLLAKKIRYRTKVRHICKWSYKISCGNRYLAEYAEQFNPNVLLNPTTVDTETKHIPIVAIIPGIPLTIGWTGSHSTLKYLIPVIPVLKRLEHKYPEIRFLVIADTDPKLPLKNFMFLPWNLKTEIADLAEIDIGIMPLPDDPWTRGKCGLKALQCMALGIPVVVSPVGVNAEIVRHGIDGFLCNTETEWFTYLEILIENATLRKDMGISGRQTVVDRYSVNSNTSNFLSLFQ